MMIGGLKLRMMKFILMRKIKTWELSNLPKEKSKFELNKCIKQNTDSTEKLNAIK